MRSSWPPAGCLQSRSRPEEDRRLVEAQRKVGELSMEFDILRALNGGLKSALRTALDTNCNLPTEDAARKLIYGCSATNCRSSLTNPA